MTAYQYDYENRLVKITHPDQTSSEYLYDGGGRRLQSMEDSRITKFLYDGLNVIIERNWQNTTLARYARGAGYGGGIGGIISEERRPQNSNNFVTRYYHYDGIGTVTGLSNPLGYLTESFTYDAFGNMLGMRNELKDASTGGYRFSTKELSAKSGLVYFGARYYDPQIGRFITPDPLTWGPDDPRIDLNHNLIPPLRNYSIFLLGSVNPQLLHQYIYVFNNPTNLIDPWGFSPFSFQNFWETIWNFFAQDSYLYAQAWDSFWEQMKFDFSIIFAVAGVGVLRNAGYAVKFWKYPHAGGWGINVFKNAERIFGLDWHRFESAGRIVVRLHIDIPKWGPLAVA